ncbi:MAG TPA: HutD family protein [Paracoccaceae bacterium]|nr:HutD family protein [Paracoccaceae bacterium]
MIELVRIADRPPVPWKNGAGTTRELWARRDDAGTALIRISIAEISGAQDFSAFPGIDRVIAQLDGPRMVLTIDGVPHPLTPLAPLPFAGEARVTCTLDRSDTAHDLNLMCQRGAFRPAMARLTLPTGGSVAGAAPGGVTALLALSDCVIDAGGRHKLGPRDLLVLHGGSDAMASGAADLIMLTAEPVRQG